MAAFSCRAFTFASWSRRSSIAAANTAASSSGLLPFFLRPAGGDAPSVGDGELRSGDGPREGEVLSTVVDLTGLEPRLVRAGAGDPALLGLDAPLGGGALDAAAWGGAWVDPEDAAVGV